MRNPCTIKVQLSDPNPKVIEIGMKNVSAILKEAITRQSPVEIKVTAFGPALKLFRSQSEKVLSSENRKQFEYLRSNANVHFYACENTLHAFHFKLTDLLPGFQSVPSGAFEVIRLQHAGFQYFRP